jgi:hypothetical protein
MSEQLASNTLLFNVNDKVRVRLTDTGRRILKLNHDAVFIGELAEKYPYEPPKEEDGWSEWQMWSLMNELGQHCRMGCPQPFETTIQIVKEIDCE